MNILPKKRWHVRTKANIERVRRDEAEAAEKEKEQQRRILLAEQEARTNFLREKAKQREINFDSKLSSSGKDLVASSSQKSNRHVNFFQDVEDAEKVWGNNPEYEAEKKAEKQKFEQSIGLLVHLGQSSAEAQEEKPWYSATINRKRPFDEGIKDKKEEAAIKSKNFLDPLRDMKRYLDEKNKDKVGSDKKDTTSKLEDLRNKYKKNKKHKRHFSGSKSISQLRMERLAREQSEHHRIEKLLSKLNGNDKDETEKTPTVDGQQRYNSQFNPHLARNTFPKQNP